MINNAFGIILLFSQQCASGYCLAETSILIAISATLQMEACLFVEFPDTLGCSFSLQRHDVCLSHQMKKTAFNMLNGW